MRKLLLSLAICLPAIASANFNLITVNLADKQKVDIVITDDMNLKFTDTHLVAEGGKTDVSIEKSQIVNFIHRYDANAGIGEITSEEGYQYQGNSIIFHSLPAGSQIAVFTVGGIAVAQYEAEGDFTLPLDNLEKGVYVVSVNNKSFKISVK